MTHAVVVGSGPNGLAGAVTLAAAGVDVTVLERASRIGGGTKSVEATLPGLLHDECSGFHPLATDNAFSRATGLDVSDLWWLYPEVEYAHPLDHGNGAHVRRSVRATAEALGSDGDAYRSLFAPIVDRFGTIKDEVLQPVVHAPRHPVHLARFGLAAAQPVSVLARRWKGVRARALWAGVAAHAFQPFNRLASSAIGVALGSAAHHAGWPVAAGGSQSITSAMGSLLTRHGGRIETDVHVGSLADCSDADLVLLDTSPSAAARICGDRMPARIARSFNRYRHGPGAFQLSFAVEEGVPWAYRPARRAGTVHVGGTLEEIASSERAVTEGRMPERPFALVGQQYVADPGRSAGNLHPVDVYAHVPSGFSDDATTAITQQIERFAPGFRDRVVAMTKRPPTQIADDNPNMIGGDVVTGANFAQQLIFRPRPTMNPYQTGVPGVYLCSAATPPGAGAHGMSGYLAAMAALSHSRRSR